MGMMRNKRVPIAVLIAGGMLLFALAGSASARPFGISVADGGLKYTPKTAHVKKGKKIKWTNEGNGTHTVTFYKKPSGSDIKSFSLNAGDSKKRKPDKKGVYKYRCVIGSHSSLNNGQCTGMCGKLKIHK
jgi:plastocyanin